jgi:hypothetical protein
MKRRSFALSLALIVTVFAISSIAQGQETMTVERFRAIASTPGDNTPLNPKLLAAGPVWTNATISIVLKYATGKTATEEISGTAKTIKGNYVVATVKSELYKQPMDSIVTYDDRAGCYKFWGLYGESVTEGLMVYDYEKKIYTTYSAFGEGFLELGVSSYSNTNNFSHTLVLKNGVLFCTRDVNVMPAKAATK